MKNIESGNGLNVGPREYTGPLTADAVNAGLAAAQAEWAKANLENNPSYVKELQQAAKRKRREVASVEGPELGARTDITRRQKAVRAYLDYASGARVEPERLQALWQGVRIENDTLQTALESVEGVLVPRVLEVSTDPGATREETIRNIRTELDRTLIADYGLSELCADGKIPSPAVLGERFDEVRIARAAMQKDEDAKKGTMAEGAEMRPTTALELVHALRGRTDEPSYLAHMRTTYPELWEELPALTTLTELEVYLKAHTGDPDFKNKWDAVKVRHPELYDLVRNPIVFASQLNEAADQARRGRLAQAIKRGKAVRGEQEAASGGGGGGFFKRLFRR